MIDSDGMLALAVIASKHEIAARALHRIDEVGELAAQHVAKLHTLTPAARRQWSAGVAATLWIPKLAVLQRVHRDWIEQQLAIFPAVTREVIAGRMQSDDQRWLAQHFLAQFPVMPALIADSDPVQAWRDLPRLSNGRLQAMLRRLGASILVLALGETTLRSATMALQDNAPDVAAAMGMAISQARGEHGVVEHPVRRDAVAWVNHATKTLGNGLGSPGLLSTIAAVALAPTLGSQPDAARQLAYRLPIALGTLVAHNASSLRSQSLALPYVAIRCL